MKEITMDYDQYLEELDKAKNDGYSDAMKKVLDYLQKGKFFREWHRECGDVDYSYFEDILYFLGRRAEWKDFNDNVLEKDKL